jgi:hypothetical protein
MRPLFRFVFLIIVILAAGVCSVTFADTYHFDFNVTSGSAPTNPSGAFDYDPVTGDITSLSVVWDGTAYDLLPVFGLPTLGKSSFDYLNAFGCNTVFQSFMGACTEPGVTWSFDMSHRGDSGRDEIDMVLGDGGIHDSIYVIYDTAAKLDGLAYEEHGTFLASADNALASGSDSSTPVPEPPSVAFLLIVLTGLSYGMRRYFFAESRYR